MLIKASDFHFKPTLKFLEGQFQTDEGDRLKYKPRVKNAIDLAFLRNKGVSVSGLISILEKEGISTVLRQSRDGLIYGITYVDQRTKCVFNGSALGKEYPAKAILERCQQKNSIERQQQTDRQTLHSKEFNKPNSGSEIPAITKDNFNRTGGENSSDHLLEDLLEPHQDNSTMPWQLRKTARRKRRRAIRH